MSSASSKKWLRSRSNSVASEKELDLACQIERRNWAAVRFGLPPIGSLMSNKHGIEWLVQGYVQVPTIESLHRWRSGNIEPRLDMYPAISPQNLSSRFLEFFAAIDRCTTKAFLSLDTMPGRRSDGHVPGHNYIDTLCHQDTNFLFLDAGRIHETIVAHEMGHAWVQYVDQCEDLRTMEDARNPQRTHQLAFVQSFVLDLKVNDLVRRKGFDMSPIEEDKAMSVAQLAAAVKSGFRPESGREEVFFALLVADEMLERDCGRTHELARFEDSIATIRTELAPLASLADTFADSVRRHGYENRASIVKCIDECLIASFEHAGDHFDIDRELVLVNEPESELNKFPDWLPMLAPKVKCEVGRHMAKNDITDEWGQSIEPSVTGRARVTFWSPERDIRSDVLLGACIGPPTRYAHIPELRAELLAMKHRNPAGEWQLHGGLPHPSNPPMDYDPRPPVDQQPNSFGPPVPGRPQQFGPSLTPRTAPNPPNWRTAPFLASMPGRPYMAGLGRFLTTVRLDEFSEGEQPYAYALGNPVSHSDSSGNSPAPHLPDTAQRGLFCARPVHLGSINSPFDHWWLIIPGCGNLGYGPQGLIGDYPGNSDGLSIGQVRCHSFRLTDSQRDCLCHLKNLLAQRQASPGTSLGKYEDAICRPWAGTCYSMSAHNCQDFVTTALNDCGMSAPDRQVPFPKVSPIEGWGH